MCCVTQVQKPLDVKTKFHNVQEDIVLEVQIQNITLRPMFLELVHFDPYTNFTAQDLNLVLPLKKESEEKEEDGHG